MKRKIWIVSWYGTQAGGLERIVRIISQVLKREYEVKIIDIPYVSQYEKWRKLIQSENRVMLMLIFSLFAKWIAGKGDIIITHGQNAPFIKSDFLFDHGSIMSLKRETGEFVYGGSSIFEYVAVRKAKINIAVSLWTREQIAYNYHIDKQKIVVLNNCVEAELFYPVEHKKRCRTCLLFCGRLEKAKGIDLLLQMADEVEKSQDYELKIAANDDQNAYLFENRKNIWIRCGASVEEMNDFYNSGDVLFVPSKCEGFGMGIIESLAAGVPVVTNEVGIVSELVVDRCPAVVTIKRDDSIDTILYKAGRIAKEYQDLEKRKTIHSYIEKNFGMSQYADKLLRLIRGEKNAQS